MIEVISPGIMASVQDAGRSGWRNLGVGSSGAMDIRAFSIGNLMVGNDAGQAGIEITLGGLSVRFTRETVFALTGADVKASLDNQPLPGWWVCRARAGQVLKTGMATQGMRAVLSVCGGIAVPVRMGSCATDLKGRFGGHEGRPLAAGDMLETGPAALPEMGPHGFGLDAARLGLLPPGGEVVVRFMPAAEWDGYSPTVQALFTSTPWKLLPDSNRMGYRLAGPILNRDTPIELLSHGIIPGTIQLPPSGQPVIQMHDANTCGGYPKLGVVIGADMPLLAQVRLGNAIRFQPATRSGALAAQTERNRFIQNVASRIALARDYSRRRLTHV